MTYTAEEIMAAYNLSDEQFDALPQNIMDALQAKLRLAAALGELLDTDTVTAALHPEQHRRYRALLSQVR